MSYTTKVLNNIFCSTLRGDYARISWLHNQAFLLWQNLNVFVLCLLMSFMHHAHTCLHPTVFVY